jgi:hypothetical protein
MRTQTRTGTVRILIPFLALVAANAHGATPAAGSVDDSRIAVTAVAGSVDVTMAGRPVAVHRDSTVLLPARIVTGHDGTLGMTQAGTTITVSNDTDVEIPAEAVDGNLVARLVQHRGDVFYDVAPRDLGKLRVETPFLVAVIKGTQFSVAVQADRTTISLFEGQLEILTPDGSDIIQLDAGEIAIRSLLDDAIRIVGMDDESVAVPEAAAAQPANAVDAQAAPVEAHNSTLVNEERGAVVAKKNTESLDLGARNDIGTRADAARGVDLGSAQADLVREAVGLGARADVDVGATVDLGVLSAAVDLDGVVTTDVVTTDVVANLDVGGTLDLGAPLDLGGGLDFGVTLDVDDALDLGGELDADEPADIDDQTTNPGLLPILPPGRP